MRVLGSRRGTGENASCLLEVKPGGGTIVPTERSHRRTLGDTTFPTEFHSRSSKARVPQALPLVVGLCIHSH